MGHKAVYATGDSDALGAATTPVPISRIEPEDYWLLCHIQRLPRLGNIALA